MSGRIGQIERTTTETEIKLNLNLDGKGKGNIASGVPFLDHMLDLWTKHGQFDFQLEAKGDTHIDDHHTVEDIGICLGKALAEALGDKAGIKRYGTSFVPMDESLVMVSLDLSGRPYLGFNVTYPATTVGNFACELVEEFLRAFVNNGGVTLHVRLIEGQNTHHIIEAIFKALGRALREGVSIDPTIEGVLSTKGSL